MTTALGDTGWVVAPSDAVALADATDDALRALDDPDTWQERRQACRARIVARFGVNEMARRYNTVWRDATSDRS